MIREMTVDDRNSLDEMQFELQKHLSNVDQSGESLPYENMDAAHQYMEKMLNDVATKNGKVFVAEEADEVVGFIQGVIFDYPKGANEIYDLSHAPAKEGWIGLLYVKPEYRGRNIGQQLLDEMRGYFKSQDCTCVKLLVLAGNSNARSIYEEYGFSYHNLEMVLPMH